jgi:hypothetical protein
MSSDVYHSRKQSRIQKTYSESELRKDDAEGARGNFSPLANLISGETPPDECLIQSEQRERKEDLILQKFADDPEATNVLKVLFCNLNKDEIMWKRKYSSKQVSATMKRIRLRLFGRNNNGGGENRDI